MKGLFSGTSGSTRELDPRYKHSRSSKHSNNESESRSRHSRSSGYPMKEPGASGSNREDSSRRGSGSEGLSNQGHAYFLAAPGGFNPQAAPTVPGWIQSPPSSLNHLPATGSSIWSDGSSHTWKPPRPATPVPHEDLRPASISELSHSTLRPTSNSSRQTTLEEQRSHSRTAMPYPGQRAPRETESGHQDPRRRTHERPAYGTHHPTGGPELLDRHSHPRRREPDEDYQDPKWTCVEKASFAICQSMGGPPLPDRRPRKYGGRG